MMEYRRLVYTEDGIWGKGWLHGFTHEPSPRVIVETSTGKLKLVHLSDVRMDEQPKPDVEEVF